MRAARHKVNQRGWLWTAIDRLRGIIAQPDPVRPSSSGRCLKNLSDGSCVEFDRGNFDEWCVYVTRRGQTRYAPRDTDYFATLKELHAQFPRLYDDFIEVFERTTATVDPLLFTRISEITARYPNHIQADIDLLLTTLCAAMIAEENRMHAPLGKRVKRLAVHQIVLEEMPVEEAADFSRGKSWRELETLCRARGF